MYRLSLLLVCCIGSSAFGGPVLEFDPQRGGAGFNRDQTVGWSFAVLETVTVTDLSWFDQDRDGLSAAHSVAIWDSDGTQLTRATIPAGPHTRLEGIWRLVSITPIQLLSGNEYLIGGSNSAHSMDRLAAGVFTLSTDGRILLGDARFSELTLALRPPDFISNSPIGFFGPSFSVQSATLPEPTTWLLLNSACLALFVFNRRA